MRVILTPTMGKTWKDIPKCPVKGTKHTGLPGGKGMNIEENELPAVQEWANKFGVSIYITRHN